MINTDGLYNKDLPFINANRPSFGKNDDGTLFGFDYWIKFHNLIKNSSIPIYCNGMFHSLDKELENTNSAYIGDGFKYLFWFKTQDDRSAFIKELKDNDITIYNYVWDSINENWIKVKLV